MVIQTTGANCDMYHIHTSLQRDSLWYISHGNWLVAFLPMVHLKCTMAGSGVYFTEQNGNRMYVPEVNVYIHTLAKLQLRAIINIIIQVLNKK